MAENKGKPSGKIAETKKEPGKHGDLKEIGAQAGAKKKGLSKKQPVTAMSSHPHHEYETRD